MLLMSVQQRVDSQRSVAVLLKVHRIDRVRHDHSQRGEPFWDWHVMGIGGVRVAVTIGVSCAYLDLSSRSESGHVLNILLHPDTRDESR